MSLRHIAKFAELSTYTVKRLLDGEQQRPAPETITKLARYFGVPRDDLMALAGYVDKRPRTLLALGAFEAEMESMYPEELLEFRREIEEALRKADEIIARRRKGLPDTDESP